MVENHSREVEDRIQQLRVAGIVGRAETGDRRFSSESSTRQLLAELETREHDQPLDLFKDLDVLLQSGLADVCVLWLEYREAVIAGRKAAD